jgi:hypothetical protein
MAIKYTNILKCKYVLPKFTQIRILGLKNIPSGSPGVDIVEHLHRLHTLCRRGCGMCVPNRLDAGSECHFPPFLLFFFRDRVDESLLGLNLLTNRNTRKTMASRGFLVAIMLLINELFR